MELINDNGNALTDSTEVGTPVSLVIRLKQMASMDTMLSTCTAHSGDDFYDLTNFQGCTEDPDILPNFKAFFNSRTGVKRSEKLHILRRWIIVSFGNTANFYQYPYVFNISEG